MHVLFFLLLLFFSCVKANIMLDPSGHAKNVGRKLVEGYERAQTLKMAEVLQNQLQNKYGIRVILSRFAGEEIFDLQNASFANRLGVDFYLNINMYRQEQVKPKIFLYHLVYNSLVDLAPRTFDPVTFIPIHQAHFRNIFKTRRCANSIKNILTMPQYRRQFDFYGVYGVPIKPLKGVIAPAVAIEIGLCKEDQWKSLVAPLVESFRFLVNTD